ncbi:uncharacterized protein C10orf143 homolog [Neopsephotus bourkii]|uniref:uncharacterized protein C10orf143 homolog n=1 Tax=Neopsephotus bourkii TaxID=309878 RepID=UPI002AA5B623|nr:uncharacterized protein C10orf143 homolog [Neopsephotus bourkii]
MAALPLPARGDRRLGALRTHGPEPGEPERKRACKRLETIPNETETRLLGYAMELDSKQQISSDCGPWATKAKQNSMVFENHGSRGTAQPCPRCIAGESGHFNHILSF